MEQTQIDGVNGWNRWKFSGIALYIAFESHKAPMQRFHGACQMWYYSFKYSIYAACYSIQNDWVEYRKQEIFVELGWLGNNDNSVSLPCFFFFWWKKMTEDISSDVRNGLREKWESEMRKPWQLCVVQREMALFANVVGHQQRISSPAKQ